MLVEYNHPDIVLIKDGMIRIEIPKYELTITAKVKQIKGLGVADADNLTDLNDYHKELLGVLSNVDDQAEFTGQQLRGWVAQARIMKGIVKEFKPNNWMRPISEFYRRGIFSARRKGVTWMYIFNKEKGMKALASGKFE